MISEQEIASYVTYLERKGISQKTVKNYRQIVNQCRKEIAPKSMQDIQIWIDSKTANPIYANALNAFMNCKKKTEGKAYFVKPKESKEERNARLERSRKKALSQEQIDMIIQKAKEYDEELYIILKFCGKYMQRISAPLDLTINRIDDSVHPAVFWIESKGERYPVPDFAGVLPEMQSFMTTRDSKKNRQGEILVFTKSYAWVYKHTKRILEGLGIPVSGTHFFRISKNTNLAKDGWSIDQRMALGGWKSDQMPRHYDKSTQQDKINMILKKTSASH